MEYANGKYVVCPREDRRCKAVHVYIGENHASIGGHYGNRWLEHVEYYRGRNSRAKGVELLDEAMKMKKYVVCFEPEPILIPLS